MEFDLHVALGEWEPIPREALGEVRFVRSVRVPNPPGPSAIDVPPELRVSVRCESCRGDLGLLDIEGVPGAVVVQEATLDKERFYTPLGYLPRSKTPPGEISSNLPRGVHGPLSGARGWWVEGPETEMVWACSCGLRRRRLLLLVEDAVAKARAGDELIVVV